MTTNILVPFLIIFVRASQNTDYLRKWKKIGSVSIKFASYAIITCKYHPGVLNIYSKHCYLSFLLHFQLFKKIPGGVKKKQGHFGVEVKGTFLTKGQ